MKDTCGLLAKLHLALSILFLVTAQWEFPLQQPMKCYCIIIHLLRPIRTYQQRKKFNLNSPLCATEWQGHEIKARSSVLHWFATPRHNRVRERGIPVLPGFPDWGGWRGGGGAGEGLHHQLILGRRVVLRRGTCQLCSRATGGHFTCTAGASALLSLSWVHYTPNKEPLSFPHYK